MLDSGVAPVPVPGGTVDFLWFTMPFVDGRNVWERLEKEGPLPAEEVIRIGRAVAAALAFANEQGVVHRDIKPDNIMLEGDRVLVADFGVARAVSEVQEKLTATGMVVGTPTYMSPEQASGERELDGRSDIFALALRALRAAGGRAAVSRADASGDAHAALHRAAPHPPSDSAGPRGDRGRPVPRPRPQPGGSVRDRRGVLRGPCGVASSAAFARPRRPAPAEAPSQRKGCAAILFIAAALGGLGVAGL